MAESLAAAIDAYGSATNVSTRTFTLTEAVPAGHMLTIALFAGSNTAGGLVVTDSKSNTWSGAEQFGVASTGVPIEASVRVQTSLVIGDTVTYVFHASTGGAGGTVSENRIVAFLIHETNPVASGQLLDGAGQTGGTTGTDAAPTLPAGISAPTQLVIWIYGVRVALVTADSADRNKITAIPSGWTELGRDSGYTTTGIQVCFVYKISSTYQPGPSDAFTLKDATHAWRTMIAAWRLSAATPAAISDTIASIADSLVRTTRANRALTDTIATIGDSLARTLNEPRALTDTIASVSDALAASVKRPRTLTDAIATVTDSLVRGVNAPRHLVDTIATVSDSLARGAGIARPLADTIASVTDHLEALVIRGAPATPPSAGGSTWESAQRIPPPTYHVRDLVDTIATITDQLDAVLIPDESDVEALVAALA